MITSTRTYNPRVGKKTNRFNILCKTPKRLLNVPQSSDTLGFFNEIFYLCHMDIRIREGLYLRNIETKTETTIRPATIGVETKGIVWFHDVSKTVKIGFSKDYCKEDKMLFSVIPTIEDREVSAKQVSMILRKSLQGKDVDVDSIVEQIYAL